MDFPAPSAQQSTDVVIVGGGIAGLSAARYLNQKGISFQLLELGDEVGGNSAAGKNEHSAYPLGAHYLPLPDVNDIDLIAFLKEENIITGEENGLPVYNEYYLCFEPKERLYINNFWQDHLIPKAGIPQQDREEIERFEKVIRTFRTREGSDGKPAFAIPADLSSQDGDLLALDNISMKQFLSEHKFSSEYLLWYVNYCCADDFGSSIDDTSAWAGLHYFASRKGTAANAAADTVLTWPEGNFFLANALRKKISEQIITGSLAYQLTRKDDQVIVSYFQPHENKSIQITAKTVILATPQYITRRLLKDFPVNGNAFQYSPWMVANITLDADLSERRGQTLSWDNVIYGSSSLGYVYANHQHVSLKENKKVITYYYPITSPDAENARREAYTRPYEEWKKIVLTDLKKPHPHIEQHASSIDIWVWGHGMIRPGVGFIWGEDRKKYLASQGDRIYFAHSDMSGISIFEEAFYRGNLAAKQCLQHL